MEETLSSVASVPVRHRARIPIWLWILSGIIVFIVLLFLSPLRGAVSGRIHLARAKNAMKERKYHTAEKELLEAVRKVPHNMEAQSYLLIAAFYNYDYPTFSDQIRKIQTVNADDIGFELYSKVTSTINKAEEYFGGEPLRQFKAEWPDDAHMPDTAWRRFLGNKNDDWFAGAQEFANELFKNKQYGACDSLLQEILRRDKEFVPGLVLVSALRREQGDYEGAMTYADRVLEFNRESIFGISAKVRLLLYQRKDHDALELASEGQAIDDKDVYMLATLAMAYHFNNRPADGDAVLKRAWPMAKDVHDSSAVKYATDVISGKEKFRE